MNGGPTVRRLHRERAQAMGGRRVPYWRRPGASRGRRHPATLVEPPDDGMPPLERHLGAAQPAHRARRPPFPISIASILDLGPDRYRLVLDGRVARLSSRPAAAADTEVDVLGRRLYLRPGPLLDDAVRGALALHLPSLKQWAASMTGRSDVARLDELPAQPLAARHTDLDDFVHGQLIPRIRAVAAAAVADSAGPEARQAIEPPQWEPNIAFLGPRWCSLVPFCGKAGNQLTLRVGGETYLGLDGQTLSRAVARYDDELQQAVLAGLADDDGGGGALYRDDQYAVLRTPGGRYYVTQRIPPYVVEGIDKELYYFEAAELGLQVRALRARELFSVQSVQVLHDYRHMFVYGWGNHLCMPRDTAYYDRLQQLPLAQAILEHLESARMTLCGGYMPQNAVMHPIDGTGRRRIDLSEARRRKLPIYWYYKPRRSVADQVRRIVHGAP